MPSPRPYRLCVLGFSRLAQLVESVAADFADRIELVVENRRFSDAQAQAQALIDRGAVDVFIGAGSNGAALRRALDYPVVLVGVTGQDMMSALLRAAEFGGRVGLVSYEAVSTELADFSRLLKLELLLRRYRDEREVRQQVLALREAGAMVVIGPSLVVEAAEALGMPAILIYSQESARQALEEAIEVARLRVGEAARRAQLAAILASLAEGVLTVDADGTITQVNRAACDLLGQAEPQLLGAPLHQALPGVHTPKDYAREVLGVGERRLLAQWQPLALEGENVAAVLTLQEASTVERAGRTLRMASRSGSLRARHMLSDLSGESPSICALRALAQRFAAIDLTVLIQGESGTGKELLAQGIHNASPRHAEAFVAINCAAMPESLLEAELFGYEEGAFTGAAKGGRAGLLETAHHGTVFLDEVGDMPAVLQVRLLRVLQEREVVRIGGREAIPIDIRIIAATHRDLTQEVAVGRFREDLYFRLNGLRLNTPPLRERREDIPRLAYAVLQGLCQSKRLRMPGREMVEAFLRALSGYAFPGNVRELENMLERLLAVSQGQEDGLLPETLEMILPELSRHVARSAPSAAQSLSQTREQAERSHLEAALQACGGNLAEAARRLNISRTTLWRKLKR